MSETPIVWFNEWRKRWLVVCALRRCEWFASHESREVAEVAQGRHSRVCSGR